MLTISTPQPEDAEAIHNVMKTSWYATYPNKEIGVTKEDGDMSYTPEVEERQIEVLRHRAENPKNTDISLIAKDDEKVVGFIRLKIGDISTDLVSLYVDPEYTGRGVGTKLWHEASKNLPKDKPIYVEVVSYTKAKDFYSKIGFVEIENYPDKEPLLSSGVHLLLTKMVYNHMNEKIKSLLLSWDEYNQKEFDVPYIYSIKNTTQELVYLGSRHCYNPKDEEFEIIRKSWNEFYERKKDKELVVIVEGGVQPVDNSEEEAIIKGGEMAFIVYLASQYGISADCFEPTRGEVFGELEKIHTREEIFYQRMAQVTLQWNTLTEKPSSFEKYIGYFMEKDKRESDWHDFDFSIENLYKIHSTLFDTDFNSSDRQFFYDIINPAQKNTIINQISRDEDVVRDIAIVKGIISEWKKGKSIFVVYGSGHAVIQEEALKTLLK